MASARSATVFGASGFVGRHLSAYLRRLGYDVRDVRRGDSSWQGADLGICFYTIGLTADFRSRPFETVDAHVSVLADVLEAARFQSFVYCSSTRVYMGAQSTDETAPLVANPADPDHLYNLSKLMGEALCLGSGRPNVRVARLSNVVGVDTGSANFLNSILGDALKKGHVTLRTSARSAKDYVAIDDVVAALEAIGARGTEPITNVAFGANTTHAELAQAIGTETGAAFEVAAGAPVVTFPEIATGRLDALLPGPRMPIAEIIPALVAGFRRAGRS